MCHDFLNLQYFNFFIIDSLKAKQTNSTYRHPNKIVVSHHNVRPLQRHQFSIFFFSNLISIVAYALLSLNIYFQHMPTSLIGTQSWNTHLRNYCTAFFVMLIKNYFFNFTPKRSAIVFINVQIFYSILFSSKGITLKNYIVF